MQIITEVVTIVIHEHISPNEFIKIVDQLEISFHSCQPGYIDTELSFDEKNSQWTMIQHWDTIENLKSASRKMFQEKITEPFRNSFSPNNIKIRISSQLKTWAFTF